MAIISSYHSSNKGKTMFKILLGPKEMGSLQAVLLAGNFGNTNVENLADAISDIDYEFPSYEVTTAAVA